MQIYVAVTDRDWFSYLKSIQPDEVNFWKPSAQKTSRVLSPGEPLLFKLHYPENYIVGMGYFVSYSVLPASLAWDAFGAKNGAESYKGLVRRVRRYRADDVSADPAIGCMILTSPTFFDPVDWIAVPASFTRNIVSGKSYSTNEPDGAALWNEVQMRLPPPSNLFGSPHLAATRLGQGAFRVLVTDAYQRRCAITGERTLPALDASHIMPYGDGPNSTNNGLLLRSDLHNLFDRGLVTVTPELTVKVSDRIRSEYGNGRAYYALHGSPLTVLPEKHSDRPSTEFLDWHNREIYTG